MSQGPKLGRTDMTRPNMWPPRGRTVCLHLLTLDKGGASELVQRLFDVSVLLFFHRSGLLEKDAFKVPRILAKTPVDQQPWRRRT